MFNIPAFSTFGDTYAAVLAHVSENCEYVSYSRANRARESRNICLTLTDPRAGSSTRRRGGSTSCSATPRHCGTFGAATTWP